MRSDLDIYSKRYFISYHAAPVCIIWETYSKRKLELTDSAILAGTNQCHSLNKQVSLTEFASGTLFRTSYVSILLGVRPQRQSPSHFCSLVTLVVWLRSQSVRRICFECGLLAWCLAKLFAQHCRTKLQHSFLAFPGYLTSSKPVTVCFDHSFSSLVHH